MIPYHLIQAKRDGRAVEPEDLSAFFRAYGGGEVPDYQMAAFLMAVYFQGLDGEETSAPLATHARLRVVSSTCRPPRAPRVDKHSTGGVGDKVSLVLAPLAAELGIPVPMMSGVASATPGAPWTSSRRSPASARDLGLGGVPRRPEEVGCALIGRRRRSRPWTGASTPCGTSPATVQSIPLIAASIMSKKLAEGIDGLVLDVKVGNGAFLPEVERALELARTMIGDRRAPRPRGVALVTAMDRPLGRAVGNAPGDGGGHPVLRGEGPADLREVTLELAVEMIRLGRPGTSREEALALAGEALADGRALERMRRIVEAQGGNPAVLDDPALLPQAEVQGVLEAEEEGWIAEVEARAIGEAAVALGAGRRTVEDESIPPSASTSRRSRESGWRPGSPWRRSSPGAPVRPRRPSRRCGGRSASRPSPGRRPSPWCPTGSRGTE